MGNLAIGAAVAALSICGILAVSTPSQAATGLAHGECSGSGSFGPYGDGVASFSTGCDVHVAKFDPTLGTLYSATLTVSGFYNTAFTGNNPTGLDQVFTAMTFSYYYGMTSEEPFFPPIPSSTVPILAGAVGSGSTGGSGFQSFVDGADATPALGFGNGGGVANEFNFFGSDLGGFIGPGAVTMHSVAGSQYDYVLSNPALTYGVTITHELMIDIAYNYAPLELGSVPEPATWAMMILGFGLLGATLRARRSAVVDL